MAGRSRSLIRLHVKHPLRPRQRVPLERGQSHYLSTVMRVLPGDEILAFNGKHGEWLARVEGRAARAEALTCLELTSPQVDAPDVWLLFAPLKKARTNYAVEKATELGVSRIVPVRTERTNAKRIAIERLEAIAVEAAEQCGGLTVPEIAPLSRLDDVLAGWPSGRRLFVCDEELSGNGSRRLEADGDGPVAVLVGPEGGFADGERNALAGMPSAKLVGLGNRILRAETAAVAALALLHRSRQPP